MSKDIKTENLPTDRKRISDERLTEIERLISIFGAERPEAVAQVTGLERELFSALKAERMYVEELEAENRSLREILLIEQSCNRCGQYHGKEPCADVPELQRKYEALEGAVELIASQLECKVTKPTYLERRLDSIARQLRALLGDDNE